MTAPANPETQADIERLVKSGVRDVRHAALRLGVSPRRMRTLISSGAVWSFRIGGKRVVPVVELRRYAASHAMEALESK